jgi:hypothetical protein
VTPEQLAKWAESQIQALITIGFDAIEAERSVNWVIAHLPPGADPRTYVFPADALYESLDEKAVSDARQDWYDSASISAKFKRILDAKATSGQR